MLMFELFSKITSAIVFDIKKASLSASVLDRENGHNFSWSQKILHHFSTFLKTE